MWFLLLEFFAAAGAVRLSAIDAALLPSKEAPHVPAAGDACSTVLSNFPPTLEVKLLRLVVRTLQVPPKDDHDKLISKLLQLLTEIMNSHLASGHLPFSALPAISTCHVSNDGRYIWFSLVAKGFDQSLEDARLLEPSDIAGFRDADGNNVFHLAVMSGNAHVVSTIAAKIPQSKFIGLCEERNKAGHLPIEYAKSSQIGASLRLYYRTYSHLPLLEEEGAKAVLPYVDAAAGIDDVDAAAGINVDAAA